MCFLPASSNAQRLRDAAPLCAKLRRRGNSAQNVYNQILRIVWDATQSSKVVVISLLAYRLNSIVYTDFAKKKFRNNFLSKLLHLNPIQQHNAVYFYAKCCYIQYMYCTKIKCNIVTTVCRVVEK